MPDILEPPFIVSHDAADTNRGKTRFRKIHFRRYDADVFHETFRADCAEQSNPVPVGQDLLKLNLIPHPVKMSCITAVASPNRPERFGYRHIPREHIIRVRSHILQIFFVFDQRIPVSFFKAFVILRIDRRRIVADTRFRFRENIYRRQNIFRR